MKAAACYLSILLGLLAVTAYSPDALGQSSNNSSTFSGKNARNRIWRLFNNNCIARHSENDIEINMCRALHRKTPKAQRRESMRFMIRVGMIEQKGLSISFLMKGPETQPANRVLLVMEYVAADNRLGRFLLELCRDTRRMTLFLSGRKIRLE